MAEKKGKKKKGRKFLSLYCTDLTEKAREGKIDRIIGRDNEIYRAVQILCRRSESTTALWTSESLIVTLWKFS